MPTVPATGQFGPPLFTVRSIKGTVVDAKWLTDNTEPVPEFCTGR